MLICSYFLNTYTHRKRYGTFILFVICVGCLHIQVDWLDLTTIKSENKRMSLGMIPGHEETEEIPVTCSVFSIGDYFSYLNWETQRREALNLMQTHWEHWRQFHELGKSASERELSVLFVSGAAGTGKTTFCRKLLHVAALNISEGTVRPLSVTVFTLSYLR